MKHIKRFLNFGKAVLSQTYCLICGYMIGFGIAHTITATTPVRTAIGIALICVGAGSIAFIEIKRPFDKKRDQ